MGGVFYVDTMRHQHHTSACNSAECSSVDCSSLAVQPCPASLVFIGYGNVFCVVAAAGGRLTTPRCHLSRQPQTFMTPRYVCDGGC
jgi:hypothetical protein